jgi:hypothetical protein
MLHALPALNAALLILENHTIYYQLVGEVMVNGVLQCQMDLYVGAGITESMPFPM